MLRRIYFDKLTGNVLLNYSYNSLQSVAIPTFEQDYQSNEILSQRNIDTIDFIEFTNGEFEQDFAECNGYRVNPDTKALEFSYPDPNQPTAEPVYVKPLTEQITELGTKLSAAADAIDFLIMGGM